VARDSAPGGVRLSQAQSPPDSRSAIAPARATLPESGEGSLRRPLALRTSGRDLL